MSTFRRGRIAVLGAGLAGLSAADILAARGLSPIVLEKMPATGGLSATVENGGLRFDYGPHRFHTKNPAILERVSAALGGGLLRLERQSRIRMLDRYFRYPLDLSDVLRKMPVASGAAMLASYGLARLKRAVAPSADLNFEDWVVSRFGRKLFDVYFGPYTAKLWGCRPSSLSSDWASQRISVPGLSGLIRDAFFPGSTGSRSLVSTFHYPRGGIGRISDALAARVRSSGGRILTGTAPGSIQLLEDGYRIGLEGSELDVDWIVNSIPLTEYVRLLGPALTDDARSAASELRFRAIVFVALQLSSRSAARDHWIYAAEDLYAFKPTPEVRSFGQLLGHIADANYMICSIASGSKPPGSSVEKTKTTKADIGAGLAASFAYCDKVWSATTDASAAAPVKMPFGPAMPRLSALAFNTSHDFEHYGNIVTYMRLNKMVPPSSQGQGMR